MARAAGSCARAPAVTAFTAYQPPKSDTAPPGVSATTTGPPLTPTAASAITTNECMGPSGTGLSAAAQPGSPRPPPPPRQPADHGARVLIPTWRGGGVEQDTERAEHHHAGRHRVHGRGGQHGPVPLQLRSRRRPPPPHQRQL